MLREVTLQPATVPMVIMMIQQLEVVCNANIIALVNHLNFVKPVFKQIQI